MNRCDGCCARALETWMHEHRGDMVRLCGHHGSQHQLALYAQGFRLVEAEKAPAKATVTQDA